MEDQWKASLWRSCYLVKSSCWEPLYRESNVKKNKQITGASRVPRPVNKIPRVLITPTRPQWANDQCVAHLQAKTVPMNLIWSESAWWLLSYGICKIPGALIMPIGMPIMPIWVNNQDVAHLKAKKVPMNLIWSELVQWLLTSSIRKIPGAFIMPMAMPIMPPWANNKDFAHLQAKTVPKNLIWS